MTEVDQLLEDAQRWWKVQSIRSGQLGRKGIRGLHIDHYGRIS